MTSSLASKKESLPSLPFPGDAAWHFNRLNRAFAVENLHVRTLIKVHDNCEGIP
jgi:hypothetical protein